MLTTFSQRILAAIMVRIGFLFTAIAVPSLFVTIIKRLIGRARPLVGGSLDPFCTVHFLARGLCRHAVGPCDHGLRGAGGFRDTVAARAHMWLIYALLIAISRVVVTAHYPTDVPAGALVGIAGAVMVRHYFAQRRLGFRLARMAPSINMPGPRSDASKRLPAGSGPIRNRAMSGGHEHD